MSDIKLRLDGADQDPKLEAVSYKNEIKIDESIKFSPEEEKQIDDFSKKIDLEDSNIILQYGVGAQKKISNFSEKTLNTVRNKDLGEIGGLLDKVVTEIKTMDQDDGGVFGFFKKQKSKLDSMKLKYQSTEKNIDEIAKALDMHQITLLKDISMLDQMYELNEDYYKELSMYIEAGNRKASKNFHRRHTRAWKQGPIFKPSNGCPKGKWFKSPSKQVWKKIARLRLNQDGFNANGPTN